MRILGILGRDLEVFGVSKDLAGSSNSEFTVEVEIDERSSLSGTAADSSSLEVLGISVSVDCKAEFRNFSLRTLAPLAPASRFFFEARFLDNLCHNKPPVKAVTLGIFLYDGLIFYDHLT